MGGRDQQVLPELDVVTAAEPAEQTSQAAPHEPESGEAPLWFVAVDRRGEVVDRVNVDACAGGWHEAALWC